MANPKHLKAIRRGAKGRGSPTRTSEKRSSSRRISAKRPNDAANVYDSNLCTKNISGANLRGTTLVEARCTWQDRSARSRHSVLPALLTQAGSRPDQTADNVSPNYAIAGRQRHLHLRSTLRRNARRRRLSHALATHPRTPQSIRGIYECDRDVKPIISVTRNGSQPHASRRSEPLTTSGRGTHIISMQSGAAGIKEPHASISPQVIGA